MKKAAHFIKAKLALVSIVVVAAAVGGTMTAVVSAAIPDSSGTIHGCYRNAAGLFDSKGTLRTINSDTGETCTAQETALNWSQNPGGPIAYAHLSYDYNTGSITLDTSHSHNVTSVYSDPTNPSYACLHVNGTPKSISALTPGITEAYGDFKDASGNWASTAGSAASYNCSLNDPTANAGVMFGTTTASANMFVQVF